MSTGREIRLIEEDDGWWSAVDEETGVASQGPSREEALEALDEALRLHRGEGEAIEDEDAALRDLGLDPEEIKAAREENRDLPSFMQ